MRMDGCHGNGARELPGEETDRNSGGEANSPVRAARALVGLTQRGASFLSRASQSILPHGRNSFTGDHPLRSHVPRRPRCRTASNVILCRICLESIRQSYLMMWQCVGDLVCVQDCGYIDLKAGHGRYIGIAIHVCFCEAQNLAPEILYFDMRYKLCQGRETGYNLP